jgi:hypothetical protein
MALAAVRLLSTIFSISWVAMISYVLCILGLVGSANSGETTPADKQGEDSVTKPAATTAVPKATPKSSAAAMAISTIACAGVAFASVVLL